MEQQVNLYQPILGAEKRLFSFRAIVGALLLFAASLLSLAGYGAWRAARLERAVTALERQAAGNTALAARAEQALRPAQSLAELDAQAKVLAADIDARQRALDTLSRDGATPVSGFAARLQALAHRQLEGVWLDAIVLGSGPGRLAMRGAATDPRLLPLYLAGLAQEPALQGARFDKLAVHSISPAAASAPLTVALDAPELSLPKKGHAP